MKCQYCGEPSGRKQFCSDWHSAICVAELYGCNTFSGNRTFVLCTDPMKEHKTLCSFCIHRLERVVARRCSGVFRKIQDDTETNP